VTAARSGRPAVLIVDDEESVRQLARRILEEARFDVTMAASGDEALQEIYRDPRFDLLVADLQMPGLQGDETARRARAVLPDLKVLFVTGHVDRLFVEYPMLAEGEAFLEKPYTVRGLLEAVYQVLYGTTHGPEEHQAPDLARAARALVHEYWQKSNES
jgi:CheY-like chemotaxis protein